MRMSRRPGTAPPAGGVVSLSPNGQYSPAAAAERGRASQHLHPLDLGGGVGVAIDHQPPELIHPLAEAAAATDQLDGVAAKLVAGEPGEAVTLECVIAPLELVEQRNQQLDAVD